MRKVLSYAAKKKLQLHVAILKSFWGLIFLGNFGLTMFGHPTVCLNENCRGCQLRDCHICGHCLKEGKIKYESWSYSSVIISPNILDQISILAQAEFDEQHMNNYRRLYPRPYLDQVTAANGNNWISEQDSYLTEKDWILQEWYRQRCLLDKEKCSNYK